MRCQTVKNTRESGFTLAELLIVALIIGVLTGLALPNLTDQLEKARQSTDIANLRGAFASARIAEISGDVTVDGHRIRISDDPSDLRDGDAGYAAVFWYDADRGLYPDKDSLTPADDTTDLSGITADKSLITSRLMARGTRMLIDDNLPDPISYDEDTLIGQSDADYAKTRIQVTFVAKTPHVYALESVRFAPIQDPSS